MLLALEFVIGFIVYFGEPLLSVIKMPYCIIKYMYACIMFPFFRRRVRKLTTKMAYELGVAQAMNWKAIQPTNVREFYQWL